MFRHPRAALVVAITSAVLLVGCASGTDAAAPASDDDAAVAALGGADQFAAFDELYQAALDSGQTQVVFYGPPNPDSVNVAFQERFPGITITSEQLQGADLDTRLDAEKSSGNHTGGLVQGAETTLLRLVDNGYCAALDPVIPDVPAESLTADGKIAIVNVSIFGIVYNTDLVDAEEVPQSWEELLDPTWKSKISIVTPATGGVSAGTFANMQVESNEAELGLPYIEKLKAQDLNLVASDPLAVQAVATGETPLAIMVYRASYQPVKDQGAPIEFAFPLEANNVWTSSSACVLADAPAPEAAQLYLNWRYSPEGQEAFTAVGSYPVMPGIDPPEGLPPLDEVDLLELVPVEERVAVTAPYIKQMIDLFTQ